MVNDRIEITVSTSIFILFAMFGLDCRQNCAACTDVCSRIVLFHCLFFLSTCFRLSSNRNCLIRSGILDDNNKSKNMANNDCAQF